MGTTRRGALTGTRRAGLALAGVLAAGLAVLSVTAFASAGSSPAGTAAMTMATHGSHVGTTRGWYDGHTVTFKYTKNFMCRTPPLSKASSECEGGSDYSQTPAATFDPLYVVVPLGFTPARPPLQCPVAGHCIDHPATIDLSSVLGSGTSDLALSPHSHLVTTTNSHQAEWWNVVVVGVTSPTAWDEIVHAKSHAELEHLQTGSKSGVSGNIVTNLFLYFAARK